MRTMISSATTAGRKFELFYSLGGHNGPFHTLASAIRWSIRLLLGSATETRILIRDRALVSFQPGFNVAAIEKTGTSIDVVVLDSAGNIVRASYGINHSRAVRRDRFKQICRRGNDM